MHVVQCHPPSKTRVNSVLDEKRICKKETKICQNGLINDSDESFEVFAIHWYVVQKNVERTPLFIIVLESLIARAKSLKLVSRD